MERRDALKIAGAAFAGVGAVYGVHRLRARTPGPVTSVEFYGIGHNIEDHVMKPLESPVRQEDKPVIDVDIEAKETVADGVHFYGSSECDTSEFGGFEYDSGNDAVKAVVRSRRKYSSYLQFDESVSPLSWGCTADLASTTYRIVVSFERLPARFAVEERHDGGVTTVRGVEIDSDSEGHTGSGGSS